MLISAQKKLLIDQILIQSSIIFQIPKGFSHCSYLRNKYYMADNNKMKPAGKDIYYCNFDVNVNKISNVIPSSRIKAVIMGNCGTGKTTFMNKACGTNHKSGITRGSCTRGITWDSCAQFPAGVFQIYDTPGTDSKTQALEHAKVLRASLTSVPLNLILILVRFDQRWENTFEQFNNKCKIFKPYQSLIVMLISRFDVIPPEKRKGALQVFQETKNEYKVKCPIIFYSNETSRIQTVVKLLYSIGQKNQPLPIVIDDENFYQHFNIANPKKIENVRECIDEIQKKCQMFIKIFKKIDKNTQDINDYVADLKIYMKFQLKKFQDVQYDKYSKVLDDETTNALYLKISQVTHDCMQQTDFIADRLLPKTVFEEYQNQTNDIRDMIKQCPYCGLIWMKVYGCNNTSCGNRPTDYFDYFANRNAYKYNFNMSPNGELKCTKQNLRKLDKQELEAQRKSTTQKYQNEKERGCKKSLQWNKLPRLPNIEEVLTEYFGTSTYSEMLFDEDNLRKKHFAYNLQVEKKVKESVKIMKGSN